MERLKGWPRLRNYVIVPWFDELGRPPSVYGRWPGADLPLQKDHVGWKWKSDKEREAWEGRKAAGEAMPEWEEPRLPKTFSLPGKDSKCVPLCFDRVVKAGHDEAVIVEGWLDALMLQARGETRACAPLAAQLSREQLKTLQRCGIKRAFICGDPDGGGDRGTVANVKALAEHGVTPFVVPRLPDGLDPDEFVVTKGIEAWRALLRQSRHGYRHLAGLVVTAHKASHGEREPGDDVWVDALRDAALSDARTLPRGREDWLRGYFAEVVEAAGGSADDLLKAMRESPGGHDDRQQATPASGDASGYTFSVMKSPEFFAADFRQEWLVKRLLVRGPAGHLRRPEEGAQDEQGR
jgi:hypothetical protein